MKIIIAGGRDFKDYDLLKKEMRYFLRNINADSTSIEIVSGGQCTTDGITGEKYGADYLGERFAKENGYAIKRFPADWNKHGKAAGPFRNETMANYVSPDGYLVAFWDKKSKGTYDMIKRGVQHNLKGYTIYY